MKHIPLILSLAVAFAAPAAFAHPDHDDMPTEQVLKLEFAKKKDGAMVYVSNNGEKVSTVGATGTLTLTTGKTTSEIALKPVGANGMETAKAAKIPAGTRARATITTADKATVTSDFLVE